MTVLAWLFNKLTGIFTTIGLCGLIYLIGTGGLELWQWILAGAIGIGGLVFGIISWGVAVPPRWFWVKSSVELFNNKVASSIGYGIRFFLSMIGVISLVEVIKYIINM